MVSAVNSVLAQQRKRIFSEGQDSKESKIGTYSTKPTSISRKSQVRQTGQTYFPGGYRQYKSLTGRQSSFVTLVDTGQMMLDLGTTVIGFGEYGIGFSNTFNADKAEWMEDKYKKDIFSTTDREDDTFVKVVEYELERL